MIKRVRIFASTSAEAQYAAEVLRNRLLSNNYIITDDDAELIISIGGDGTFLQTLSKTNFNTNSYYIGILCGHLGFLQEINIDEIDAFISDLKNMNYSIKKLSVLNTVIQSKNGIEKFYSLNESVIREKALKALHINLMINDKLVEKFYGDGIIVSTPTGSTAYNLSAGGSIVHPELDIMQITHIAPISSSLYRSLNNSIIVPFQTKVSLIPAAGYSSDILVTVDGMTKIITGVEKINVSAYSEHIKTLKFNNYCFWKRIKEKFL